MKLRRPTLSDLPGIELIATEPLPGRFVEAAVIEHNGSILSFGVIRSNMEAILYASGSHREKVEGLKLLIEKAIEDTKKYDYKYLEVLARDEAFAQILIKHFGFERISGIPLNKAL